MMQQTSKIKLSNYQKAILTEMDIQLWGLLKTKTGLDEKSDHEPITNHFVPDGTVSQNENTVDSVKNALSRLAALKQSNTAKTELPREQAVVAEPNNKVRKIDKLLLSFSATEYSLFVQDILLAIGLEGKDKMFVKSTQLIEYSDYSLAWQIKDKIQLEGKFLSTPDLPILQDPLNKKLLWQIIQDCHNPNKQ
ncbi:hypothetical protein RS130_18210 [Paraglaciecola aquimarina]|uniref:Uncharacterized protein n=1 Tax=Paraglaciecola aquimarina TaxID=1235557 RepID=A0ABU3T074_9ALTE|nr:hypothetical protein [Paraglaciecola aquimarina]MDU0355572.1 hypothetical protein [Paraglaciecola aquimarina]